MSHYTFPRSRYQDQIASKDPRLHRGRPDQKGREAMICYCLSRSRAYDITRNGKVCRSRRWPEVLCFDTDRDSVENPRFAEKSAGKLAKAQRRLARARRGSNDRQNIKTRIENPYKGQPPER